MYSKNTRQRVTLPYVFQKQTTKPFLSNFPLIFFPQFFPPSFRPRATIYKAMYRIQNSQHPLLLHLCPPPQPVFPPLPTPVGPFLDLIRARNSPFGQTVGHYGKNRRCRASNLCRAPSHGKETFAVRLKEDARQRARRMAKFLGDAQQRSCDGKDKK